ncbi:MAG: DNA polymerase III subunit gamma/tau [Clostridia bacterium]|nr:DNA polymerase III subunit gamma/tau [Clostridia bacterium]
MSYQALYRRYRPKTFSQIVGQEHICTALANQIKNGTISHAYIFNGTRGVGKTTAARVFASACNCLNPKDGNPCLECQACRDYAMHGNVDIVEMDAASYSGVDSARDLREKVNYMPSSSKYKVYIIDEAHALSVKAFDALLKTLEEPPKHAIFILCTTEIQKFPATILSRCMRFDFRLIATQELVKLLSGIFDELNIQYTPDAVMAIANSGEGSARDALTIADRCVAYSNQKLTYDDVIKVLGATSKQTIGELVDRILSGDSGSILHGIDNIANQGKSISVLCHDICKHFRDLLVVRSCSDANSILCYPQNIYEQLEKTATSVPIKKLLYGVESYSTLEYQLKTSLTPQILFEAVTLRYASSSGEVDVEGLDMRITRLEQLIKSSLSVSTPSSQPVFVQPTRNPVRSELKTTNTPVQDDMTKKSMPPSIMSPIKSSHSDALSTPAKSVGTSSSNTRLATQIWAEVLENIRYSPDLVMLYTISTQIKKLEIVNGYMLVYCSQPQCKLLEQEDNINKMQEITLKHNLKVKPTVLVDKQRKSTTEELIARGEIKVRK